jgi:integrase/recombinase XerD
VPLILYRRHEAVCRLKLRKLRLKPKQWRFYRDCECPVWLTGTTNTGVYPRQSTKLNDWAGAEALARTLTAEAKDTTVHGPTLADCVQRFLDAHAEHVQAKALGQYKLTLGRLQSFAHGRNKHFIRELDVDTLEAFKTYGLTGLASTSKANAVAKLKLFLREAYRLGWTTEALALKVKSTVAVYEQKQPYTDSEVTLILEEAGKLSGGINGYATNGITFRLLLELMLETGLRVSDAIRYDPAKCTKSKYMWMYSFMVKKQRKDKKPKQVEVYLTAKLKKAIDKCKWFSTARPFTYRNAGEQAVYERMQAIGERCSVADCRPHRLRDTFAVRTLLKGVPLEEVSKLLGHSSTAVTEQYYAAWIPERKLRLERLLSEALAKP